MWKPPVNFLTLHYAFIIFLGLLGLVILYPYGNLHAVDAYFFGVSAATESGINTVDVKSLKTYQQVFIYFVPMISNLGFINIIVVVVRLYWFGKRLKAITPRSLSARPQTLEKDNDQIDQEAQLGSVQPAAEEHIDADSNNRPDATKTSDSSAAEDNAANLHVSFADGPKALYIPSPREQDRGQTIREVDAPNVADDLEIKEESGPDLRRRLAKGIGVNGPSLRRAASSMLAPGMQSDYQPRLAKSISLAKDSNFPRLSSQATLGRNSQFHNLTEEDREQLGGIEYRSLKLLLKIVIGFFFGLHILGAICLVGWIRHADPKYRDYLDECGQGSIWWGFYSAQTMVDNLGFTLTPDSMVSFRDATFPMLIMSFLAYAGNTLYPCVLRLIVWVMYKLAPEGSSMKEPLNFLLRYPRRCYTLLFRSKPTWILFGIIFAMNFIDVLFIVVLDLNNPAVSELPGGSRVVAAIFQSASARHTGTASFNLADVNPAVQLSLLVMMYISIFPIAISVRASNIYEERTVGVYETAHDLDENSGTKYVLAHMQNQLTFDLWYIFLGIFVLCISESGRIMDPDEPGFSVFAIFFEVVSAYGNVGLSLGYPGASTSLSGQFNVFSKVVVCLMMIRGRHRGLPYQVDRAILLPSDRLVEDDQVSATLRGDRTQSCQADVPLKVKRYHTQ
ncbi:cation transporter [Aspergillus campestris IBT 28561]|uniref:Cation transporter n=1 Tax=Aspergillus campestris (strain IBT 28561) TaxID=1392248 RepID=A0A2I1DBZ4_ASPC2|nr:cation transporter [Aspergillus campestris IBT 28561]PKY07405.1 cation transporter [Aspergillus campestris IBT 28561]